VVALWNRCSDRADPRSAWQVEKLAVHHGVGEFLESEWTRILVDHGSTERPRRTLEGGELWHDHGTGSCSSPPVRAVRIALASIARLTRSSESLI
jgi:hypothetical protein